MVLLNICYNKFYPNKIIKLYKNLFNKWIWDIWDILAYLLRNCGNHQVNLLKPDVKQSSMSYPYLQSFAPKTIEMITAYLPFGKDMIQKIGEHLAEVSK